MSRAIVIDWRMNMVNITNFKLFVINPTKVKVAVIIAIILFSLLVPEIAFAAPSPGGTGS